MLAATYRMNIERHEVEGISALTFEKIGDLAEKPPFVFVIHGLTSRKERHLEQCLALADAGFRVGTFDLPGHGERRNEDTAILFSEWTSPGFATAFIRTVVTAVAETMTLAHYFGEERYALVGHSMGGFISLHLALNDPRVSALVNIAGSIDTTRYTASPEAVKAFGDLATQADVAGRAAELAPLPILLLHGDADETVPVAGAIRLYEALRTAYGSMEDQVRLVRYPGLTHRDFPRVFIEETVAWLSQYAKGATGSYLRAASG